MTIGNRIKTLRTEKKLSQECMAEKLSVSRQAVSKWESGASSPSTDNLIALTELFGVSVDHLVSGEKEDSRGEKGARLTGRLALVFFLIALAAHCTGIFTGEFDRSLNGILWIGCGDSPTAIALNILTVVFTIGWVSAAAAAVYLRK